jgi:NAD(P)-dependent dehydrogenase (short-subunit alcohol dehydrogenase family)
VTESLFSLAGKKALVTGASRGIGEVIAVAFARAGADVALTARTEAGLTETASQIRGLGRQAVEIPADLTDRAAAEDSVRVAVKELGQLDIVVNNAGGSSFVTPFLDMRQSGWDKVLRLNLDSTMWICQAAGAHLTARGTGSVINVASVAGLAGAPFLAPYGRSGVRVNALCPGWTATDLNRVMWDSPDGGAATIANVPMGRWGRAEEMAGPAVFLASDAASFMTGQVLVVDGGQTATA